MEGIVIGLVVAFLWVALRLDENPIVFWIGVALWTVVTLAVAIVFSVAVAFLLFALLGMP